MIFSNGNVYTPWFQQFTFISLGSGSPLGGITLAYYCCMVTM